MRSDDQSDKKKAQHGADSDLTNQRNHNTGGNQENDCLAEIRNFGMHVHSFIYIQLDKAAPDQTFSGG